MRFPFPQRRSQNVSFAATTVASTAKANSGKKNRSNSNACSVANREAITWRQFAANLYLSHIESLSEKQKLHACVSSHSSVITHHPLEPFLI